jgi:hypothetical protein
VLLTTQLPRGARWKGSRGRRRSRFGLRNPCQRYGTIREICIVAPRCMPDGVELRILPSITSPLNGLKTMRRNSTLSLLVRVGHCQRRHTLTIDVYEAIAVTDQAL